jgi:hypothetical protein
MKNLYLIVITIATLLLGCKKEEEDTVDAVNHSIIGKWELRHIMGVQVAGAPSTFAKGNGDIILFSDDQYQRFVNGQLVAEGSYTIVQESANIDGTSYNYAVIYGGLKWYYNTSRNKLKLSIGSVASDGVTVTYEKI